MWNSLRRVCKSKISVDNLVYCSLVSSNCSMKNLFANVLEPTGVPSSWNPSVSSMPMVPLFVFSTEKVLIVSSISAASEGLMIFIDCRTLWPEQEVRMRDFSGLMKHPRSAPSNLMCSSKKARSTCGTVQLISSTHANR